MTRYLSLLSVCLLATACASNQPSGESANGAMPDVAAAVAEAPAAQVAEWQSLRQKYTACATEKAEAGLSASGNSQSVAATAMKACKGDLEAMRTSFRKYLDSQMSSSHGKTSARQAADRVGRDTEDKTRAYLVRHVEYKRAVLAGR